MLKTKQFVNAINLKQNYFFKFKLNFFELLFFNLYLKLNKCTLFKILFIYCLQTLSIFNKKLYIISI